MKNELEHEVPAETAANALTVGFRNALAAEAAEAELTQFELELAEKLYREKYSTDEWNLQGKSVLC